MLFSNLQHYQKPHSRIRSIGIAIPERAVDNEELMRTLKLSGDLQERLPDLLSRTTGIKTRHYAPHGTSPSDLACEAAVKALEQANLSPQDIDTLIFASTDFDLFEPATANILQSKLGMRIVNSFDIKNACNSVLQAINIGNSLIMAGNARHVLIASGEMGSSACSREINHLDELNHKIGGLTLGDAGAALILEKSNDPTGVLEINLVTLGEYWPLCHVPTESTWRHQPLEKLYKSLWFYLDMAGLAKVAKEWTLRYFKEYQLFRTKTFGESNLFDSIECIIPHQISTRYIEKMLKHYELEKDQVGIVAQKYGNTASTSIFLALDDLLKRGDLQFGANQEILFYGAASGFSLGHIRLRL